MATTQADAKAPKENVEHIDDANGVEAGAAEFNDDAEEVVGEEGDEEAEAIIQEVEDEEVDEVVDAEAEAPEGEAEAEAIEADEEAAEAETVQPEDKEPAEGEAGRSSTVDAEKKKEVEDDDDGEETGEEAEKKMAAKFDPNKMPQVDVSTLAQRKWQVKVYPLRPSDFMSGQLSRVFKQARESLLYLYTAGNNGRYSNGKAELYMSNLNQAVKVMLNIMKMDFFHPETNIRIIRKDETGAIAEKAWMRYDTKMARLLFQSPGPVPRAGTKRERIIGSVFLKNLPDGATKDMLRVMFPFASEINFNPEKFKESTARLVLSNRNSVIPCLKAFSKVELGKNILELRPLEKRKKSESDDTSVSVEKGEKAKTSSKSSTAAKEAGKGSAKKEEEKSSASKDDSKKSASSSSTEPGQKEKRKTGPTPVKKQDPKRLRGGFVRGATARGRSSYSGRGGKFSQRWQDERPPTRGRGRGGVSSYRGGGRSYYGDAARSPIRVGAAGLARQDAGQEMTQEMMQLQAQLSVAIKNQLSMLNQTQLAVEQAKRGAAAAVLSSAGGAAQASFSSRDLDDHYGRAAEVSRRNQAQAGGNRQRLAARNRANDRRDSFGAGNRNRVRGNRGAGASGQRSNYGNKRNFSRAGLDADSYEDVTYPKRSNLGLGASPSAQLGSGLKRSWAEESEDLDLFYNRGGRSNLGGGGGYSRDEEADYTEDDYREENYRARAGGSGRAFGAAGYNMNYDNRSYDYNY